MKVISSLPAFTIVLSLSLPAGPAAAQAEGGQAAAAQSEKIRAATPVTASQTEMKQVLHEYDAKHFDRAMDLCQDLIVSDPNNPTAHYVLGNIYVKLNNIKNAVAEYQYCLHLPGAKTSAEAAYAKRALEQIKQQKSSQAAAAPGAWAGGASGGAGSGGAGRSGPMVGSSKSAEECIQEETDLLMKESREKLAVKQRTLDDKVGQIQEEMKQQMYNLPRVGMRRVAASEAKSEAQEQLKEDAQRRIDQLKKDFQREVDDLNQYYQNRISALSDHYHNLQSRASGGGSR